MGTIRIVAEVTVMQEHRDALIPAFTALVSGSRSEPGNVCYDLTEEIGHPGHFFFIEEWQSEEALAEHNESPHFQAFVAAVNGKTEKLVVTKLATVL